jgi:hypothetical protein
MRFLAVFLMALGLLVFLDAVKANAAPVKPDIPIVVSPCSLQKEAIPQIPPLGLKPSVGMTRKNRWLGNG